MNLESPTSPMIEYPLRWLHSVPLAKGMPSPWRGRHCPRSHEDHPDHVAAPGGDGHVDGVLGQGCGGVPVGQGEAEEAAREQVLDDGEEYRALGGVDLFEGPDPFSGRPARR